MAGRVKNPCGKSRPKDKPYEVWAAGGWEWRVLKKYGLDDSKPFARAFCFVSSPACPDGEYGDVYIESYRGAVLVKKDY